MFISKKIAQQIATIIYNADKKCRIDLFNKFIAHEDNYTASFTTRIYDTFNSGGLVSYCLSKVLTKKEERRYGCDGVFIFHYNNSAKIGLFEAKWPRFNYKPCVPWDKMPAKKLKKKLSHFSNQLKRQHTLSGVAIWEMFYDNRPPGNSSINYDKHGSSCIWHKEAFDYFQKNIFCRAWNNSDINTIIKRDKASKPEPKLIGFY